MNLSLPPKFHLHYATVVLTEFSGGKNCLYKKILLIIDRCVKPSEMNGTLITDLSHRNYQMRCLDLYNHTPEKDAKLLFNICILAMISMPFLMAFALYHKRNQRRNGRQIFLRTPDYASYSQLKLFPLEKETGDS